MTWTRTWPHLPLSIYLVSVPLPPGRGWAEQKKDPVQPFVRVPQLQGPIPAPIYTAMPASGR